jgi:hypothetical protein
VEKGLARRSNHRSKRGAKRYIVYNISHITVKENQSRKKKGMREYRDKIKIFTKKITTQTYLEKLNKRFL